MTRTVFHSDEGLIDRFVRRGFRSLAALRRRASEAEQYMYRQDDPVPASRTGRLTLIVPRSAGFQDQLCVPGAKKADLQRIAEHERARLSPQPAENLVLLTRPDQDGGLNLLHLRASDLEDLEDQARRAHITELSLASEDAPDRLFETPNTSRAGRTRRALWLIAVAALLLGMWTALTAWQTLLEEHVISIEMQEAKLRSLLLARTDQERDLGALGELAALSPQQRSPQGRLEWLAALNSATPDGAWWKEIELSGHSALIRLEAESAASVLETFERSFPDDRVGYEGTLADTEAGNQSFQIAIERGADP